jgi:redox-sensitive bicupin YhaK (pirin superfamily)
MMGLFAVSSQRRPFRLLLLLLLEGTTNGFLAGNGRTDVHQQHVNCNRLTCDTRDTRSGRTGASKIRQSFLLSSKESSSSSATMSLPEPPTTTSLRRVATVEKFARLPVWPVWMGVVIFVVSRTLGNEWAAKLEDAVGGRVCPNFFSSETSETSPFIMLVHHRHSFAAWDPIRWIQSRFILPEGFPAHPHRGFTTLTYFMKGGFRHRDSLGIEQDYGCSSTTADNKDYPHSQWLFTGAGLLHEEMFDQSPQQELYQLWVNVPSQRKLDPPDVQLLGNSECPRVEKDDSSETVVLAGDYDGNVASTPIMSDMAIFHVRVDADSTWTYDVPATFDTVVLYIRQGSCSIDGTELPVHHTAYLEPVGKQLVVSTLNKKDGVDFLLLAGAPLREPVAAQGSMVMNTGNQINEAYQDYQRGLMGNPWDYKLSNEEWLQHVAKNPCRYQYSGDKDGQNPKV